MTDAVQQPTPTATLAEALEQVKPKLRGVSHQWALLVAPIAGLILVILANGAGARIAAGVYALSLCAMLAASSAYHRLDHSPARRVWMRRLDHSMIFVLVAGTYTPFSTQVVGGTLGTVVLIVVWSGALLGAVQALLWISAPRWFQAALYLALGWVSVVMLPAIVDHAGWAPLTLLAVGGAFYSIGAVVYATQKPDPIPAVFGFHEVFHVFVLVAAACQYAAVAGWALGN